MTLRLPPALDAQLDVIAQARHTSKHALILAAADRFVRTESKTARVIDAVDEITEQYAATIDRLAGT